MRPFLLRDEDPPDDAVVVVRGGTMDSEPVRRSAGRNHDEFGFFGLSVYLVEADGVVHLCGSLDQIRRYAKVRLSTVGRVRSQGFALMPTLDAPHFDIVLPDLERATLNRLDQCFDLPIPNPGRR